MLSATSFDENTSSGSVVATLSTSDPDKTDTHTYSLVDNAGGKFAVNRGSLIVKFKADFETPPNQ